MEIYHKRPLTEVSFFHKLFKMLPKQNYIIELENLLSENEDNITAVKTDVLASLKEKYKVNDKDFKREREVLLDKYINKCIFDDQRLSDDEKQQLSFLRELLCIDEHYLKSRIEEEGLRIYKNKVSDAIWDGVVTEKEKNELEAIKGEFSLSVLDSRSIYNKECQDKIQRVVDRIIFANRCSPDDDKELNDLISGLNVSVHFSTSGLNRLRELWRIENGELPVLEVPIALHKNETCCYKANVNWYEERTRTVSVSYSGYTYSRKVTKHITYRSGNVAPSRHTEEYMKLIDSGKVYFTNKRIIFVGKKQNKVIPWTKILDFTPFNNGIEIGKETGKKPFFEFSDVEMMGIYIARLLNDSAL